jgi:leucyl-tRNA synthetase
MWERMGGDSLWDAPWPAADPALLVADQVTYAVQVNGKLRGSVEVPADLAEPEIIARARAVPNVSSHLDGKTVRKEILVPGRLVNLVVG